MGEFSNGGAEWHPTGEPTRTKTHDFVDKDLGRAVPYEVYDLANDEGWVSVGDTADTASFAVEAIRRWWYSMGKPRFPAATKLLVTADAGGSNGYRVKLWKVELAKLAHEIGLEITVVHYPPGTSKWNRIEHRMFSFISTNWRGRPLVSYRTIIEFISNTTTAKGLKVRAEEDLNYYETGTNVSPVELAAVPLSPHKFHGDWNYTIAQSVNRWAERVVTDSLKRWRGKRLSPVQIGDVERNLALTAARYNRAKVYADPWQAAGMIQRL